MRFALALSSVLALTACNKKSQDGLPPAQDWQAGNATPMGSADKPSGANPHAKAGVDPHAGMNIGGAGASPADPHAGLDMGSPHGGMPPVNPNGSVDVTQMGLSSPDPNRKVDPSRRIKGVLKIHAKAKDRVKAGGAVFLIVKKAGPDGVPSGPPLAVDKVLYQDNLAFELTEANAMVAGTELVGDVVVSARFDQDSDALSKQPGDVTGQVRVKVPAENLVLMLDTVLP
ncbi:MAG: hypothetical protein H0T89_10365 [Deltaproteobacteria bacterium]|nr:hypothetical protein [Deltaproteobacteria bacterium]MDQ3296351.1 hypothetical protein [Myxococcota bacterium]